MARKVKDVKEIDEAKEIKETKGTPFLGGQYYIVYSLGTIFCRMLPAEVQCPRKYTCPRGQYWNS